MNRPLSDEELEARVYEQLNAALAVRKVVSIRSEDFDDAILAVWEVKYYRSLGVDEYLRAVDAVIYRIVERRTPEFIAERARCVAYYAETIRNASWPWKRPAPGQENSAETLST